PSGETTTAVVQGPPGASAPAIDAIGAQHAVLNIVGFAGPKTAAPRGGGFVVVFWMDDALPAERAFFQWIVQVFQRQCEEAQGLGRDVDESAVGVGRPSIAD